MVWREGGWFGEKGGSLERRGVVWREGGWFGEKGECRFGRGGGGLRG